MSEPFLLALKIVASAGIGLLIGLEREWAHKEIGVRSFAITALLGTLSWLTVSTLAFVQIGMLLAVVLLVNAYSLLKDQTLQVTTSLTLAATYVLGVVVGMGNFFLALGSAIMIVALLTWKTELITFSSKLTVEEIRSALLLGFITAVIYPLLPDQFVDPWKVLNPRSVWLTVMLVSGLSFVNYILLRQFGTRGIRYSSLLGGLVNSAATSALLGREGRNAPGTIDEAPRNIVLADLAMILRNWGLVVIFSIPGGIQASLTTVLILVPMMLAAGIVALITILRARQKPQKQSGQQRETQEKPLLKSPLDLGSVLAFGLLFLSLTVISGIANRFFGAIGFLAVVVIGALASAVSSAVLVGQHLHMHQLGSTPAAVAMFLATLAGLLENVVIFWVVSRQMRASLRLLLLTMPIILVGALLAGAVAIFF
ncbi:MAG: MgtC/SapB family protein [Ktedonobacteraceae bacterium]|nr:MgtC/SapB family protein [Ktedonobacteraceae bacterium]